MANKTEKEIMECQSLSELRKKIEEITETYETGNPKFWRGIENVSNYRENQLKVMEQVHADAAKKVKARQPSKKEVIAHIRSTKKTVTIPAE